MRTRFFLVVFLCMSCFMDGHAQSKNTFPYGETVEEGMHRVIGKTPILVSPDLVINLSATTPYTIGAVDEDSVSWFIHLRPYHEKPYTINRDGRLLLKLGDGTVLTLKAEATSHSMNRGGYRADGKYKVERADLQKIFANGIVKWRMEIDLNEPLEKNDSEDVIGKGLKEIHQVIEPAICQKDIWSTSLSQSEWSTSKETSLVNVSYKDFTKEGIRSIMPEEFVIYKSSDVLNGIGLGALVNSDGMVNWVLVFALSKEGGFKLQDGLFLRLGNGSILNLPITNQHGGYQGGFYQLQVSYGLTSAEIEKIITQGILKFQTAIKPSMGSYRENLTVYYEYPRDLLGSIIRGQYQYIQNVLNNQKTFESDF